MAVISGSSSVDGFKRLIAVTLMAAAIGAIDAFTAGQRFYPDDPLWTDDDKSLDASAVVPIEDAGSYDFIVNTFTEPGALRNVRAGNVNTLDEVPDSSWFTNRIGRRDMSIDELRRGPDRVPAISLDGWVVSAGKGSGVQPGFRMTSPEGVTYQIEFDPPSNPEMATGAEIIGTVFYYAFGYHTVEVYLTELDPTKIVISEKARVFDQRIGIRRRLMQKDVDNVLRRAAKQPNGKYRVLASRFADGKPLGNFRYYGTRPDDPNDIVPHEHRRELRAARVFGAWLNHDDSRGVNSLDMLADEEGRHYVKHYMFDFGSIMGSGTVFGQRHRPGNEYILEWKPGWLTLGTLGIYTRPWMHIDYPDVPPAIGRFEADAFDPERWKPEYPNSAFANMRGDDAFWAARIVSRFDDTMIRAVVEKARFSDPVATDYLTRTLIARRNKVVKTWLTQVNPLVDFALSADGALTFSNAAVQAGAATAPSEYRVEWARFDNAADTATALGPIQSVTDLRVPAPDAVRTWPAGSFLQVKITAVHQQFPAWAEPVTLHFRRLVDGWQLVGLTRLPPG
jgi:hypothetical protein